MNFLRSNWNGKVFITKSFDRNTCIRRLLGHFDLSQYTGKHVALKANFNSADPFPASTHLDTLQAIIKVLKEADPDDITLGERSGMGDTRVVLEEIGVMALSERLDFNVVILDELTKTGWIKIKRTNTHWLNGFYLAKLFVQADKVVQTCCVKAHRFGGHFTMSLKNSVGMVAKRLPGSIYDYMWELHGSPYQRQLIAEINRYYAPDIVIMDGIKAFTDGGPEQGHEVEPGLIMASNDRVALDAVGNALLRSYGSTSHIMNGRIFELDQLRRAVELGIGIVNASQIKLIPVGEECIYACNQITDILEREG